MRWFTFASAPIGGEKAKGKYQTPSILNANEKVNKLSSGIIETELTAVKIIVKSRSRDFRYRRKPHH